MNKNNLKLAISIPEAFAAAAPDDALPSGDPRYVELSSCRGGENIVEDLARQIIWTTEGYLKLLLTGHRGCGKTTELYRLKSGLKEAGYFVLYWNAELELNLMDVAWIDVILTHVRQLAEQIPKIDPDIVYTVPISLLAEENIAQVFPDDPVVIPMVEVYNKPLEEYLPLDENQQGIDLLCEVVRRRIDVKKVFKDKNILEKLCVESGGHVRDFLRLVRYACRYSKGEEIDENAANRAISALSMEYDYLVKDADINKLVKVEREKRLPSDMEYAHLPYHLLVLEYRTTQGDKWASVNPLVKRLSKFKEAYNGN